MKVLNIGKDSFVICY